ncbi:unnamed protein product, partial [Didymodactylos carnosus]
AQVTMFIAFLIFEFCIGVFWPAMATMRSKYVPEEARSTIMNYFRVPLNLIVVVILLKDLKLAVIFTICVFFLVLAVLAMFVLHKLTLRSTQPSPATSVLAQDKHQMIGNDSKLLSADTDGQLQATASMA